MKKLFIIGLLAMLALAFACAKTELDPNVFIDSRGQIPEANRGASFGNIEEYRRFASSLELEGDDFDRFILRGNYNAHGIKTKADVEEVLNAMNDMPLPLLEGFDFEYASVDLDDGTLMIRCDTRDARRVFFKMAIETCDEEAARKADSKQGSLVELPGGAGYIVRAARRGNNETDDRYSANIRSHKTELITNISEAELMSALENCEVITFAEYAERTAGER